MNVNELSLININYKQQFNISMTSRLIGCAVWHMLRSNGADLKLYQMQIKRLAPFLGQLANVSKVIWLNQYPVVEKFGTTDAMNTHIFSDKIHQYNEAVRSELQ
jgi:hypothetical protein